MAQSAEMGMGLVGSVGCCVFWVLVFLCAGVPLYVTQPSSADRWVRTTCEPLQSEVSGREEDQWGCTCEEVTCWRFKVEWRVAVPESLRDPDAEGGAFVKLWLVEAIACSKLEADESRAEFLARATNETERECWYAGGEHLVTSPQRPNPREWKVLLASSGGLSVLSLACVALAYWRGDRRLSCTSKLELEVNRRMGL